MLTQMLIIKWVIKRAKLPIIIKFEKLTNLRERMLPVRPNNHEPRNTRANARLNGNAKKTAAENVDSKSVKNKSRSRTKYCGSQSETAEEVSATVNTGFAHRKHHGGDTKSTVKKVSFESKPVIRDLAKRLTLYSKQYAPEYFTSILEYMIEKEAKSTSAPTLQKINKWRVYFDRNKVIEKQARREAMKYAKRIITGRKQIQVSDAQSDKQVESEPNLSRKESPYAYTSTLEHSSQNSSSLENASCPEQSCAALSDSTASDHPPLTQQELLRGCEQNYSIFASLIQTVYQLLGENECSTNSIFPACYLLYIMLVIDRKVWLWLSNSCECTNHSLTIEEHDQESEFGLGSRYARRRSIKHRKDPNQKNMVEYYLVTAILIATKYHQIYPASLVDLIDAINPSLSFERAVKIQGQVLEMLNFAQFYNQNQSKYVAMLGVVAGWSSNELNVCSFIVQSGLNNLKLYSYSPLYKAAVVIGIYQEAFIKSQQKFMMIKSLCPGLTFELISQIKKQYLQILMYNHRSKLYAQKSKFFIYDNEMKNLLKQNTTSNKLR